MDGNRMAGPKESLGRYELVSEDINNLQRGTYGYVQVW